MCICLQGCWSKFVVCPVGIEHRRKGVGACAEVENISVDWIL